MTDESDSQIQPSPQAQAETQPQRDLSPDVTKKLVEQLIGHLTALGVIQAQRIARDAVESKEPQAFLERERARAMEVMRAATVSAPGLNSDDIRAKALAVISQTFDNIKIGPGPNDQVAQAQSEPATRTLN